MTTQKISWDNYKAEIELMTIKTRQIKRSLLILGRKSHHWNTALGDISKILLIITGTGGGIQLFGQLEDTYWLTILRTILEILIGIIITTRDAFNFEKQTEKYYSAEKSINVFYEMLKFQSFQIKGTEGDRLEILKGFNAMYTEILANNQIIQTVESISTPSTPDDRKIEIGDDDSLETVEGSKDPPKVERRESKIEDRTRMIYLQKMLNDIR
jgi:hypothetical protein